MWSSNKDDFQKMTALISAQDLHKSFGSLHAVNGISLEVNAGEIYGLVGADGAGKTTTIRLLCGAIRVGLPQPG
jgi:ABC-2 type transport system ATP-binding protein